MDIYDKLNIPEECRINRTVFKKMFYENAALSKGDKDLFVNSIDKITWIYCLNQDNMNISAYTTDEREYLEIEIMEVALSENKGIKRIAEIIMRAIPNPMLLIFDFEDKYQVWTAHQRFNLADNNKITLEEPICTEWLDNGSDLWDKLDISNFRYTNFFDMYSDIVDAVAVFNAEKLTDKEISGEDARKLLRRNAEIDSQIAALRAELKKATEFNRKMEINMKIKKLEKERNNYANT